MNPFHQIHINKTGGASIRSLLGTDPLHEPAKLVIQKIGLVAWENLFTFTIVRNPFDRMVSLYHYRLEAKAIPEDLSFIEFINLALVKRAARIYNRALMFKPCLDWLTYEGQIAVEYIGTFKAYETSVLTILEAVGLTQPGPLQIFNKTNHAHYSIYYDAATKQIVGDWFLKDLEEFGYTFEENGLS